MGIFKHWEPDPDVIRFDNLKKMNDVAKALAQDCAGDPEALAFLQKVRDWVVRKMIDELE